MHLVPIDSLDIRQTLYILLFFRFSFGNDHSSLPDSRRENIRNLFSKLQVVIIDEMSMMKSDQLYQLNLRLQEIKQSQDNFGGVSVILLGDLMQLRPVKGKWIFEEPFAKDFQYSFKHHPLWDLFTPIELKLNHRQGSDKSYADILNRVRYGKQTTDDIKILMERVKTTDLPSDALYIFNTNKDVIAVNNQRLSQLPGQLVTIKARHSFPGRTTFKPIIKAGKVNDTAFLDELNLKKGARVMLIFNVDTSDGLSNGTSGTVIDFITMESVIKYIMVQFDEQSTGQSMRNKLKSLSSKYQNHGNKYVTPISQVLFEYNPGLQNTTAKAKVLQFPITLAWAITTHKCQGQTIKKPTPLIADMKSIFESGQAYVILGRVQELNQLYLLNFKPKDIRVNQKAFAEAQKISENALNNQKNNWVTADAFVRKLSVLNIRSLPKHFEDLKNDHIIMASDIIILTETFLTPNHNVPELSGYQYFTSSKGRGKGVIVYIKLALKVLNSDMLTKDHLQVIKLEISGHFDLYAVYRSPNGPSELPRQFFENINPNHNNIITGDFNIPFNQGRTSPTIKHILERGFIQIVKEPTQLQGNILDHFYIRSKNIVAKYQLHYPYYSDHDALCVNLKKLFRKK